MRSRITRNVSLPVPPRQHDAPGHGRASIGLLFRVEPILELGHELRRVRVGVEHQRERLDAAARGAVPGFSSRAEHLGLARLALVGGSDGLDSSAVTAFFRRRGEDPPA